jgi:hypothetical protein
MNINLQILPTLGYSSQERAMLISEELFAISRPKSVKSPDDVSNYLFGWVTHKSEDISVLNAISDYIIKVHPDNDITKLVSLFPELSSGEIENLTNYITNTNEFPFSNILPSNSVFISDEDLEDYK